MRDYLFGAIAGLVLFLGGCSSPAEYHARRAFVESRSAKKLKVAAENSMKDVRGAYAAIEARLTKAEARASALERQEKMGR